MKDVTAAVVAKTPVAQDTELIWDEVRATVILFSQNEPLSFISLDSRENREDHAVKAGLQLLKGQGKRF